MGEIKTFVLTPPQVFSGHLARSLATRYKNFSDSKLNYLFFTYLLNHKIYRMWCYLNIKRTPKEVRQNEFQVMVHG